RELARFFAEFKPDLVEIGSPYLMPRLVALALRRALHHGLKNPPATVGFVHADYPDTYVAPTLARSLRGPLRPLRAPLHKLAKRHLGRTYAPMSATFGASVHVLRKLHRLGLRRLFHTPLGVETDHFSPTKRDLERRRQLGIADEERVLLFLGRLSREKGIDLLLRAWPRLAGRSGLRLVIAGHGPRDPEVATLAARDASIVRLDHIDGRDEVAGWMASADLFLSLGAFETFSLTTLEALACQTPVVAPHSGGAAELVRQLGGGQIFADNDPKALCTAILRATVLEPNAAKRLRTTIETEYTWVAACRRLHGAYRTILDAHRDHTLSRLEAPEGWWPAQHAPDGEILEK
ncbi:MAG TPA: glycosyltransferase, partial [Nannocystis exedens]|nr:glycosyltransferase [Nannocystis exedens]